MVSVLTNVCAKAYSPNEILLSANMIRHLLRWDPKDRYSAKEALNDEFFK